MGATSISIYETKIKAFITKLDWIMLESMDAYKVYWSLVSPDSVYTALSSSAAATVSSKLTKQQLIDAVTFLTNVNAFFAGTAVTQSDYLTTMEKIAYGNNGASAPISVAVEAFGDRSKVALAYLLELFNLSLPLIDIYTDTELTGCVSAVSGSALPFSTITKADMVLGAALVSNFKKMINNEVVATADYGASLSAWRKYL